MSKQSFGLKEKEYLMESCIFFVRLSEKMDSNRIPHRRRIKRAEIAFFNDSLLIRGNGPNPFKMVNYLQHNFPWKMLQKIVLGAGGRLASMNDLKVISADMVSGHIEIAEG